MTLWQSYVQGWKKYVDFRGRASRKEFWTFALGNLLIIILLTMGVSLGFTLVGNPYSVFYAGVA